ncbi:MAG TPA: hypothetical protein VF669_12345 [Tepidisphaeraceae bacterium]|jgi:hypothetical protein
MPNPLTEELDRAVAGQRKEVLPLEYAPRRAGAKPPIDWPPTIRQTFFAVAIGMVAYGSVDMWTSHYDAYRNNGILWLSIGATVAALMMPWPGRVGRKK